MSETRATSIASALRANHPGLLDWLPDETLFSLVSRQHAYWAYRLSSQTSALLFGGARLGTQHDLPGGLTEFAKRTGGILGSPKELSERTLLRYYALGMDSAERDAAIATMSSSPPTNAASSGSRPAFSSSHCSRRGTHGRCRDDAKSRKRLSWCACHTRWLYARRYCRSARTHHPGYTNR